MTIELICLDADDTLWHNMRHFEEAEAAFVALLQPFADAGIAHARLEAVERRNLAVYGYGAKSFTLSMIETAVETVRERGEAMPVDMIARILAAGRRLLAHPVELLPGIEATLDRLADQAALVLVTKGDLLHQEAKLAASGLGDRFSGIEIVSSAFLRRPSSACCRAGRSVACSTATCASIPVPSIRMRRRSRSRSMSPP